MSFLRGSKGSNPDAKNVQRAQKQLSEPLRHNHTLHSESRGYSVYAIDAAKQIEKLLEVDDFQFPQSEQREEALLKAREYLAKRHAAAGYLGFYRWESKDAQRIKDAFDQYVEAAPDRVAQRVAEQTQSVKNALTPFLSEGQFDELAILEVLKQEAAELPEERKPEIAKYIQDSAKHSFSPSIQRAINDLGYAAAENALLDSLEKFRKSLPTREAYPYKELVALYTEVRATFYDCIPQVQDEIIQAVAELEQVLNSEKTLTQWGGTAENKVQGVMTLLNELKSARAEPRPNAQAEPTTPPDPWSIPS